MEIRRPLRPLHRTLCLHYPQALARERFEAFAETCLEFTPQIALRETHAVFLEISASLHLFGEEVLPIRIRENALRFGIPHPRIVIADDPGTALVLARYALSGPTSATLTVPVGTHRLEVLNPLPLEALQDLMHPFFDPEDRRDEEARKKITRVLELLKKLGLRSLEDFARLPARQLPARFGREGAELSLQLRNPLPALWPVWAPVELIRERFEIDSADPLTLSGCGDLGGLLEALRIPLDRCCERLRVRGLKTASLRLVLTPDIGSPRDWILPLPVPQSRTDAILPLIRDRLDQELQRSPFESTISTVEVFIEETAPGSLQQRDFFSRKEEASEAWDSLLGRLTLKLGEGNAFCAKPENSHRPEACWSRVLRPPPLEAQAAEAEVPSRAMRPLRLLREPLELQARTDGAGTSWLFPKKMRTGGGKHWRVEGKLGPERITGEWWRPGEVLARDYFRIKTQNTDEDLWVYITREQRIFLQGFF